MSRKSVYPVAAYGCQVNFQCFHFHKIRCDHGPFGRLFSYDSDTMIVQDALPYVQSSWYIYCKKFLEKFIVDKNEDEKKEYLKAYSDLECTFGSVNVKVSNEKVHFDGNSFFVFGFGRRLIQDSNLSGIVEKFSNLAEDLATNVARFIYLFNETDVFWEICPSVNTAEDNIKKSKDDCNQMNDYSSFDGKYFYGSSNSEESDDFDEFSDSHESDDFYASSNSEESSDYDESSYYQPVADSDDSLEWYCTEDSFVNNAFLDYLKEKSDSECTLGHFDAIEFDELRLEKIKEYKKMIDKPKLVVGCY